MEQRDRAVVSRWSGDSYQSGRFMAHSVSRGSVLASQRLKCCIHVAVEKFVTMAYKRDSCRSIDKIVQKRYL